MANFSKNKSFIIFWSTKLSSINGQNIVTKKVLEVIGARADVSYLYPPGGGGAILGAVISGFLLFLRCCLDKNCEVYLVCSRSSFGFLRDIPALAPSLFRRRVVVHVHGSTFPDLFRKKIIGKLAKVLYKNCEILVPSSHLIPELKGLSFSSVRLCENFAQDGIGMPVIDRSDLMDPSVHYKILWNSNIMSSKGIVESIEAVQLLVNAGYKAKFVILGQFISDDEMTKQQISQLMDKYKLYDFVEYVGATTPQNANIILKGCDCVLLPSTYPSECQPLSVIQAMKEGKSLIVCGTPALRATVGSYPARFADRNSFSIMECVKNEIISRDKYDFSLAATEAAQRFSVQRFERDIRDIFSI